MTIDWQEIVTTVGVTVGSSSIFLAAAAWLIRTVLLDRLTREADRFRTRLRADADMEIERLRSSLQMVAVEHQVRFSKLHDTRAEVIADLYKQLVNMYWHGKGFVLTSQNNPTPAQKTAFENITREVYEVTLFMEQHQIYLPESVCALLEKFIRDVRENVYAAGIFGRIEYPNQQTVQQSQEAFSKAYKEFENDLPAARKALETEFRKILGVEQSQ